MNIHTILVALIECCSTTHPLDKLFYTLKHLEQLPKHIQQNSYYFINLLPLGFLPNRSASQTICFGAAWETVLYLAMLRHKSAPNTTMTAAQKSDIDRFPGIV